MPSIPTTTRLIGAVALLLAALLSGCDTPPGVETPEATQTPTAIANPTATEIPATPSPAPGAGATPTAAPTATATEAEPTETVTAGPDATEEPAVEATATATAPPAPDVTLTFEPGALIDWFRATPETIDPGDPITLSWSSQGDTATIYALTQGGVLGEWWEVEPEGELTVTTGDSIRNSASYILYVGQGELLDSATASVTVRCTAEWFFSPAPEICPQDAALASAAAQQRFEHGVMIWLGAQDRILVLYGDGAGPAYEIVTDAWQSGMPESDPAIEPPAGLYQPVRGFGLVWRGESSGYSVRERLGWALAPEQGYDALWQCDSPAKYTTCFVSGPAGGVTVLEPERSGWHLLDGGLN